LSGKVTRPEVKATLGHRFAVDTAIPWRTKKPTIDQPPNNIPQFPGQLIAVDMGGNKAKLYVGKEDLTGWAEVI
jgi:hypothetical protein